MVFALPKKKILLLLKLPPPRTGAIAVNKYVSEIKSIKEKYEVELIPVSYKKDTSDLGTVSLKKIFLVISIQIKLIINLFSFKPNLIYFQISPLGIAFYRDLFFVLIFKIFRRKVLYHLHGKRIAQAAKNRFVKMLYKFTFHNSEIICLSDSLSKDIANVYRKKPFIVNNGIPDFNDYIKNKNEIPRIMFLSNLFRAKGLIDFLDALKLLKDNNIFFYATIIGGKAELTEQDLITEITNRDLLKEIEYLGPIFNNKKVEILNKSDIFVHPTHDDAFPINILEAMRAGLPVVATGEGAIPEMIADGISGYIVEKKNIKDIAQKIEFLIKNPYLRTQMGKSARNRYLEKYTLEIFEKNVKNVFDSVLAESI